MSTLISDRVSPKKSQSIAEKELKRQHNVKSRRKSFATMQDAFAATKEYPPIGVTKKSIVSCSYSEMGCEFHASKEKLEELMKHTNEKSEYHLRITTDAYKKLKAENEETKKKYDKLKNDWNVYHMKVGMYSTDKLHPTWISGKSSQPDLRKLSRERKLSPGYLRRSSNPKEDTREKRLSGGKDNEVGTSEGRRKDSENFPMSPLSTEIEIKLDLLTTGESEKDCGTNSDVLDVDERHDQL